MCGRFYLIRDPAGLKDYYGTTNPTPNHAASWNVAPTQDSLVLRRHPESGERHLNTLRWGLIPHWAKDSKDAAKLINARAEGLAAKPSFREAFAKRRCLVPMDGFYEWRKAEDGSKQAFAVAMASGEPMTCAGLWENWKQPDSTWLRSFTIITTESAGRQAMIHHRMPVILPPETWDAWLGAEPAEQADLLELLVACPDEELAIWPVDNRVGRVAENDAAMLRRDPLAVVPKELDDPPPAPSG